MSSIVDKTIELFAKHSEKLPQAMILIYLYCVLFPTEAAALKDLLLTKIQTILPEAFSEYLSKVSFSPSEIFSIWAFLLIVYAITIILDITHQLLRAFLF